MDYFKQLMLETCGEDSSDECEIENAEISSSQKKEPICFEDNEIIDSSNADLEADLSDSHNNNNSKLDPYNKSDVLEKVLEENEKPVKDPDDEMSALTMSNCNKKAENRVPCNISREENDQAMNIFHRENNGNEDWQSEIISV